MDNLKYDKARTMALYNQRKREEEEAKQKATYLRGSINSQINSAKESLSRIDKRLISHYNITIPEDLENASSEQLNALLLKLQEVEQALGQPTQQYLETGNIEFLKGLPVLDDLSVLTQDGPQQSNNPTDEPPNDDLSIYRG